MTMFSNTYIFSTGKGEKVKFCEAQARVRQGWSRVGQLKAPNGPYWPKRPFNSCLELTYIKVGFLHLNHGFAVFPSQASVFNKIDQKYY